MVCKHQNTEAQCVGTPRFLPSCTFHPFRRPKKCPGCTSVLMKRKDSCEKSFVNTRLQSKTRNMTLSSSTALSVSFRLLTAHNDYLFTFSYTRSDFQGTQISSYSVLSSAETIGAAILFFESVPCACPGQVQICVPCAPNGRPEWIVSLGVSMTPRFGVSGTSFKRSKLEVYLSKTIKDRAPTSLPKELCLSR